MVRNTPSGNLAVMLALKEIGGQRPGPGSKAAYGHNLAALGVIENDRCDAGDVDQISLDDAQDQARRHRCIEGIATRFEHLEAGMRAEIMPGGDHMARARDGGSQSSDSLTPNIASYETYEGHEPGYPDFRGVTPT